MSSRSAERRLAAGLACLALIAGCTVGPYPFPDFGGLYNRAAQFDDETRNPVIVIPGVLGSALRDQETERVVWGAFRGRYANPRRPEGARLVALPIAEGVPLHELRDGVEPEGVLDRVRVSILGLPVEQHAYLYILRTLGVGGYRDEDLGRAGVDYGPDHFTCFQFPYDWRRDNAENARRLHEFILEKKAYVAAEFEKRYGRKDREIKFDVVAHSMGGLLLRYYLRYGSAPLPDDGSLPPVTWVGARHVERAVLIATPNAGSVEALADLVNGSRFAFLLPRYDAGLLGTMPALYQLLPRTRHRPVVDRADPTGAAIDVFDLREWEAMGWGLASPGQDEVLRKLLPEVEEAEGRRRIALDHLRKALARAGQFQAALDVPVSPPDGLSLYLFAGDADRTPAVAEVDRATGKVKIRESGPGDGTVLRSSAIMDERVGGEWAPVVVSPIGWANVTFVFSDHLDMTRDPAFTDNVLYRLLEAPR